MPLLANTTSHWPEGRRDSRAEAFHWMFLSRPQGWGRAFRPAPRADWLSRCGREEGLWGRVPGVHRAAVRGEGRRGTGGNWEGLGVRRGGGTGEYWGKLGAAGENWGVLGAIESHWGLLGVVVFSVGATGAHWEGLGPTGVNWGGLGGTDGYWESLGSSGGFGVRGWKQLGVTGSVWGELGGTGRWGGNWEALGGSLGSAGGNWENWERTWGGLGDSSMNWEGLGGTGSGRGLSWESVRVGTGGYWETLGILGAALMGTGSAEHGRGSLESPPPLPPAQQVPPMAEGPPEPPGAGEHCSLCH